MLHTTPRKKQLCNIHTRHKTVVWKIDRILDSENAQKLTQLTKAPVFDTQPKKC